MAIVSANSLHRQREQNILAQNVFQPDPFPFIEGDLAFPLVNLYFFLVISPGIGAIKEIEIGIDRKVRRLQATIALRPYPDLQMTANPDFPKSVSKKLDRASHLQRRRLLKPLIIFDLTRGEGHLKADLL